MPAADSAPGECFAVARYHLLHHTAVSFVSSGIRVFFASPPTPMAAPPPPVAQSERPMQQPLRRRTSDVSGGARTRPGQHMRPVAPPFWLLGGSVRLARSSRNLRTDSAFDLASLQL